MANVSRSSRACLGADPTQRAVPASQAARAVALTTANRETRVAVARARPSIDEATRAFAVAARVRQAEITVATSDIAALAAIVRQGIYSAWRENIQPSA